MVTVADAFGRLTDRPVHTGGVDRRSPGWGTRLLRWTECGDGPPVVLVGGAGEVSLTWAPVFGALSERGRVVACDRAGLGESDPVDLVSVTGEVDDLATVLDAVGPAVVVGHSWGGLLAQAVAWLHPARVSGLVLVDPTHEDVRIPARLQVASRAMLGAATLLHRLRLSGPVLRRMGASLASVTTDDPAVREVVAAAYAGSYASPTQFSMIVEENRIADGCGDWVRPLRAGSSLGDLPVVVLAATSKPDWLRQQALDLHRSVALAAASGHYVEVDSGHYVHHEQPDAVLSAVDQVLAQR